tara:strand:+ start:311 stop:592 length:282 start_codon:yes stop_codon:yes gene_type:complete
MGYEEAGWIVLILVMYFLGRNIWGNTSEEEQKYAGFLGAAIMFPVRGFFVHALILGFLSSPFFGYFSYATSLPKSRVKYRLFFPSNHSIRKIG